MLKYLNISSVWDRFPGFLCFSGCVFDSLGAVSEGSCLEKFPLMFGHSKLIVLLLSALAKLSTVTNGVGMVLWMAISRFPLYCSLCSGEDLLVSTLTGFATVTLLTPMSGFILAFLSHQDGNHFDEHPFISCKILSVCYSHNKLDGSLDITILNYLILWFISVEMSYNFPKIHLCQVFFTSKLHNV